MEPESLSRSSDRVGQTSVVDDLPFRLFADSIANLAWIADPQGSIYWYNQRWYEYTGTTFEQMEGWGWQSVHDPAELPKVLKVWKSAIANREAFDMVFPLRGADGTFRPFLTRVVPSKDPHGEVRYWFGTNTDISRELRTDAALRHSEARFRTATEAVSAILWTNNAAGAMLGDQPGWSAFTGQSSEQYLGYGWSSAVHPDDAQPTIEAWQLCVRKRCLFAFEHRVRRRDGLYRLCSVRALPIIDEQNEVLEWVGVHTDITDERETQRALSKTVAELKQQQQILETAQHVSRVGFWRLTSEPTAIFLSSGSRHLLGLPAEGELSNDDIFRSVDERDRLMVREALRDGLTSGHYSVEFRTQPMDDAPLRWILGAANKFTSDDGTPYLVGMNMDITQQKLSAEALLRNEKLAVAGRLAASIAHEINNPLEAMTNLLYLLLQGNLEPEQRSFAVTLGNELQRVSQIATHTLQFHRQSTLAAPLDIAVLLDSVTALYEGRRHNAAVTVQKSLAATRMIHGFDGELRQVLANLIGNALDAMHRSRGTRTLLLRSRDATSATGVAGVRVTVADTGHGMSSEVTARVFDAFFTTKEETGTGLGLWVSSGIVAKHRGTLRVRSSIGQGTVFQLFLPTGSNT